MKVTFLGGAQTVTGSRFLIEYRGHGYLVDAGLFQGPKELRDLNWTVQADYKKVKGVILTHAHIDHSGYLPRLVKEGYKGPIYCSHPTLDLTKILLLDAAYLQEEDAQFANKTKHSSHSPALPLYTHEDALQANKQLRAQAYYEWVELEPGLSFQLLRAGHILGASLVLIRFENRQGDFEFLCFTGDLGHNSHVLLSGPDRINEVDYLVMESTYGDRLHLSYKDEELASIINTVLGRQGTLVIPSFALGRSQEILFRIRQLEDKGLIASYPIYLDSPMALDVTDVYLKYQDELKIRGFSPDSIWPTKLEFIRKSDDSMLLAMSNHPKIVVSASGMLQGGRVLHHLKTKLPQESNGVLFIGYQGEGTKGRLLREGIPTLRLYHQEVEVNAEIFTIDAFSSHADQSQLLEWVSSVIKKPKIIFLVHGESSAQLELSSRLLECGIQNVIIPQREETFVLDDK